MAFEAESYEVRHEKRSERARRKKAVLIGIAAGCVIGSVVGYLAFGRYISVYRHTDGALPLIKADTGAFRIRPETPGGMDVPNQDKLIYERLRENDTVRVEKLMPAPEKPYFPEEESAERVDVIAQKIESVEESSLEVASTKVVDENGAAVEVMFRTIPEEQAIQQTATVKAAAEPKKAVVAEQKIEKKAEKKAEQKSEETPRFAVQLVSTKSAQSSESEWKRLSKKHADVLKALPHEVAENKTDKASFFRLRAGDFETRDAAAAVCEKLKSKKQECLVVKQ